MRHSLNLKDAALKETRRVLVPKTHSLTLSLSLHFSSDVLLVAASCMHKACESCFVHFTLMLAALVGFPRTVARTRVLARHGRPLCGAASRSKRSKSFGASLPERDQVKAAFGRFAGRGCGARSPTLEAGASGPPPQMLRLLASLFLGSLRAATVSRPSGHQPSKRWKAARSGARASWSCFAPGPPGHLGPFLLQAVGRHQ